MNLSRIRHLLAGWVIAAVAAWPQGLMACAVCSGRSDSKMAEGMNAGILLMLAILAGVLASFAVFFINLFRKSAAAAALPPKPAESKA